MSILFCLWLAGCQGKPTVEVPNAQTKVVTGHGGTPVQVDASAANKNGTIEALKGMKLTEYPAKTIGDAFDGYTHFTSKEWRETRLKGMKIYLDFYGMQKTGVLSASKQTYSEGVNVKFVIYPDGTFAVVMVSKVQILSDGKMYVSPIEDKKAILDAIYENKAIGR